ncbi:dimethylarginine dimethylaminohydrolase family protein [Sphingobacterium lactis]|uniref:dimethylarginine dimethylaminohydrolase family protein n=1 Tax=Sphingobacterium lactis TaxID=797291 RepID=UPI003F7EC089
MLKLQVNNESDRLHSVILGTATRNGPIPQADEAYDPKSLEHILQGTYPQEADMVNELNAFENVLKRYAVQVYRPEIIEDLNQIFTRDIGFVIEDKFIKSNILPDRAEEWNAIQYLIKEIPADKLITAPEDIHMEGGDVLLWNDHIFVGTYKGDDYASYNTARTNMKGVEFIRDLFPKKEVKEFNLIKSMTNPRANALHLDCCFQPVGKDKAIVFPGGFIDQEDYQYLEDLFGLENLFQITADEMYQMFSNVFSIAPDVVVTEKQFTRLNNWLREQGFTVEEIPYHEIGKQEGLLRCSTLPLMRG